MSDAAPTIGSTPEPGRSIAAAILLIVLVAAADWLLIGGWGINLALWLALLGFATILFAGRGQPLRQLALAGAVLVVLLLPLIEAPAALPALYCAILGLGLATVLASGLWRGPLEALPAIAARFAVLAPVRLVVDATRATRGVRLDGRLPAVGRLLLAWVAPLLLALVFLALFAAANPLIEQALRALRPSGDFRIDLPRIALWLFAAAFAWPFLAPRLLATYSGPMAYGPRPLPSTDTPAGLAFTRRSLIVFNLLFAVETVLDLVYLWGGVKLPAGMSYAEYAHRGAYPLIATALLAALFVLVTMRPGGSGERDKLIRRLVFAFIVQNVLLVASSILRLDLYVDVYGLTDLRLASGVWMGLVAVGLVLILLRIVLGRSNRWLVATNLAALSLVFYGYAVVDTDPLIARFNLGQALAGAAGPGLDVCYLTTQGPTIVPALDSYLAALPAGSTRRDSVLNIRADLAVAFLSRPSDWRNWTWRDARLAKYLADAPMLARPAASATPEDVTASMNWCRDQD